MTRPPVDEGFDPAVRVVEHNGGWADLFAREASAIAAGLLDAAARIDHVGSTAVSDLPAKPIVDIQVSVRDIRAWSDYVEPLERLGYLFVPDPALPEHHFFGKPLTRPRQFHVHVCEAGGHEERRHLAVRDYLRADPDERDRYGALKVELGRRHLGDRAAYMQAKEPFLDALEDRALRWRSGEST